MGLSQENCDEWEPYTMTALFEFMWQKELPSLCNVGTVNFFLAVLDIVGPIIDAKYVKYFNQ
jgi:hypothetical protein